jgi:ABC-type lipoprotein release transport system permease subunit
LRLSVQRSDGDSTGVAVFYISGKFKTESLWFDNNLLISLEDAQKLFGTGDRVTGLGVWLGDDYKLAYRLKRKIQHMLIETSGFILSAEEKAFFENLTLEPQKPSDIAKRAGLDEPAARKLLSSLIEKGAARAVGHMDDHYVESTEPQVKTWAEQQPDIFRAVAQESLIMRVILVIVIAFVAVLVLCLLWVMVEQKVRDIGIMVAIGARTGGVVSIFVLDGLLIGLVGTTLGVGLGVLIATYVDPIAKLLGLDIFPESQFYVGEVPSTIAFADLALVSVVAVSCSVLASILPALRAAAADPIESLRHE